MTDNLEQKLQELQKEMSKPDLWQNKERAAEVVKEYNRLKKQAEILKDRPEHFKGEYDTENVILSISAGTGGTEAQDWASMLLRMYLRFSEKQGFKAEIIDKTHGQEAGIKNATLLIKGPYAFGWLKSENGVHRLVRISPFDADRARHTSFTLVEVIPEIPNPDIEIEPSDLKIETFRSSGPGGQYVQKTESAVRVIHLPTKIVAVCQSERSQLQNKEAALKILKSRLYQLKLKEKEKEVTGLLGKFLEASWGNQIRSYVLAPYQMVKDHRTGWQSSDPEKFLNGEIEEGIIQYLKTN